MCQRQGPKIRLAHNEFAYKNTKDTYNLGDKFLKKANFQSQRVDSSQFFELNGENEKSNFILESIRSDEIGLKKS